MSTASRAGFWNGWYCVVSTLLREEGCATTQVHSLFSQGTKSTLRYADPDDLALFKEHGLIPAEAPAEPPTPTEVKL